MSEFGAVRNKELDLANLKGRVLREILTTFRASKSPRIPVDGVEAGVELLFELLAHRIEDDELDALGDEIVSGLCRWFEEAELLKLADRYEPFCKFVLKVIDPAKFGQLQAKTGNRLAAAKVLKALGLVTNKTLSVFESCAWENFPPVDVVGKPDFLEHVARTYVFRNVDDHQARVLNQRQKAEIAESFCVFLVWCVVRFDSEIQRVLTTTKFADHLKYVRQVFADVGTRFVELATEARSADEYRLLDPIAPAPEAASSSGQTDASKLAEMNRVTIIEAEPGAGKTTTLQFLAWQQADGLLGGNPHFQQVPVYLELKLLSHQERTIESDVKRQLKPSKGEARQIPWNSLLLLVDGVNEVATQHQTRFKAELRDLLLRSTKLRVVLAGRLNSFRGEFEAQIVVLQPLCDEQLSNLFRHALGDEGKAAKLLAAVQHSSFLSLWARTPLHAAMVVTMAKREGINALSNHATTVRRFIRGFLDRETSQASAGVIRTDWETKELVLARLAFETKSSNQGAFSRIATRSILATAKATAPASSLDISNFLEEIRDNHLLERADVDAMVFAHELYHDYFAATEMETREQIQAGVGVELALSHFSEAHWSECVRLFAGFSNSLRTLVERGAEKNPFLAWQLLRDASDETPELVERVADEAFCALSADLQSPAQARMAGACIFVLAELGHADLLEQAITEQRQVFEPDWPGRLTDEQEAAAREKQKQVVAPLAKGLSLLVRLGLMEQQSGSEGRFCQAARLGIHGLERIKAARGLCAMLSASTGSTFNASALIPGAVLDALINLGVDEVLNRQDKSMNETLATWLKRASEAGFSKAWPPYGRVLRLARRSYVADYGLRFEGNSALKWLRQSHEAGDSTGTLELALLLVEEPKLDNEADQGERLLRLLSQTNLEARYELGLRLLKGNHLPMNATEGFEHLLSAAEGGHAGARIALEELLVSRFPDHDSHHNELPVWAKPHKGRLRALFPNYPLELS